MSRTSNSRQASSKKRPAARPTPSPKVVADPVPSGRMRRIRNAGLVIAGLGLAVFIGVSVAGERPPERPEGIQQVEVVAGRHNDGDIEYDGHPVGGEHNSVWLNCGVYTVEVPEENVVHSLEHGAVWVSYRPDLPPDEIAALEALGRGKVIVSPRAVQPAPVVAAAWGEWLEAETGTDPRVADFVTFFAGAGFAPEPRGACTGGLTVAG